MAVTSLLDRLLHLLVPAPCLGCGEPLPACSSPLGLCRGCRGRLERRPSGTACRRCARPLAAAAPPEGWECGACRTSPPSYDRLLVAWSYAPPLDEVIRGLKFRRLEYLGRHLGAALADLLGERIAAEVPGPAVVVPMPLHWRRHLVRGYNQAELLAGPVAGHLGMPLCRCLRRRRLAPPQSSLGRAGRAANLRDSFRCRRPLPAQTLLLVDDVVTTGVTLEAAAACLKAAGARRVVALVAARTPRGNEV